MKWQQFLKSFNRELLKDRTVAAHLPEERLTAKWLGYPPATRKEIAALEARLKMSLPRSYRAFLEESNGWLYPGRSVYKLWSTRRVSWFRQAHRDWIAGYRREGDNDDEFTDDEYFNYGPTQMPYQFKTSHLAAALQISDVGDLAVYLLNPKVKSSTGEWEAWLFANWLPGARRYQSFEALMVDARLGYQ